jgi:hypothetical protein
MRVYFSLREANDMVQKIREKIERISQLMEELDLLDNTKIEFENEDVKKLMLEVELNKNFHSKNLEMYNILGELIEEGCIIRNLEEIDVCFYSKLNEKDINFCWKPEHNKIQYWRYVNENFKTKRNIKEIEKQYYEKLNTLK